MLSDTTSEARRAQRDVWRRMGPAGRVRLAIEMSEDLRRITLAGMAARHPEWTPEQLRRALLERLYGDVIPLARMRS